MLLYDNNNIRVIYNTDRTYTIVYHPDQRDNLSLVDSFDFVNGVQVFILSNKGGIKDFYVLATESDRHPDCPSVLVVTTDELELDQHCSSSAGAFTRFKVYIVDCNGKLIDGNPFDSTDPFLSDSYIIAEQKHSNGKWTLVDVANETAINNAKVVFKDYDANCFNQSPKYYIKNPSTGKCNILTYNDYIGDMILIFDEWVDGIYTTDVPLFDLDKKYNKMEYISTEIVPGTNDSVFTILYGGDFNQTGCTGSKALGHPVLFFISFELSILVSEIKFDNKETYYSLYKFHYYDDYDKVFRPVASFVTDLFIEDEAIHIVKSGKEYALDFDRIKSGYSNFRKVENE